MWAANLEALEMPAAIHEGLKDASDKVEDLRDAGPLPPHLLHWLLLLLLSLWSWGEHDLGVEVLDRPGVHLLHSWFIGRPE